MAQRRKTMNRAIIRILGTCLGGIFGIVPHVLGATESETGKTGHAIYNHTYTQPSIQGYVYYPHKYGAEGIGCNDIGVGGITGCNFDTSVCSAPTGSTTTPGTGTGGAVLPGVGEAEDSLRCAWYKCMTGGGYYVPNCNGYGKCNSTGLYCQYSGIFIRYGVSYTGETWGGQPTNHSYTFVGCDTGWYRTNTGAPCDGVSTGSYAAIGSCCTACPGMKNFNSKTATAETYVHGLDTNGTGGYRWISTGVGVASCTAFPPQNSYQDDSGYYDLSSGCPYKS